MTFWGEGKQWYVYIYIDILNYNVGWVCWGRLEWLVYRLPLCASILYLLVGFPQAQPYTISELCLPDSDRHRSVWVASADHHRSPNLCNFPYSQHTFYVGSMICVIFVFWALGFQGVSKSGQFLGIPLDSSRSFRWYKTVPKTSENHDISCVYYW
jgi:hypothetical protein